MKLKDKILSILGVIAGICITIQQISNTAKAVVDAWKSTPTPKVGTSLNSDGEIVKGKTYSIKDTMPITKANMIK